MTKLLDRLFIAMHLARGGITWGEDGTDWEPIATADPELWLKNWTDAVRGYVLSGLPAQYHQRP